MGSYSLGSGAGMHIFQIAKPHLDSACNDKSIILLAFVRAICFSVFVGSHSSSSSRNAIQRTSGIPYTDIPRLATAHSLRQSHNLQTRLLQGVQCRYSSRIGAVHNHDHFQIHVRLTQRAAHRTAHQLRTVSCWNYRAN